MPNNGEEEEEEDREDSKQTDLAEGERETVEESIRIHEKKGDLPTEQTPPPDEPGSGDKKPRK